MDAGSDLPRTREHELRMASSESSSDDTSRTEVPDFDTALAGFFLRSDLQGVQAVYVFGSRAEGRAHRESDLDVGVLLDRATYPTRVSRTDLRIGLASDLPAAVGTDSVDVVSLIDAPPELGRRVVIDGRLVFCRDGEAEHAFRRDVQLRAADLAPWLERMRRIKLEALAR